MKLKNKLLGFYDYTVILTYMGMLFAFCGILNAIECDFQDSLMCLMLAGGCDMFDGAVASTKQRDKREKVFGIQIDSLSDLISFGILPSIFVYMITDSNKIITCVCALYSLCALIRLAFFNVLEEERQQTTTESRKTYLGVPVTTVALILPAGYLLYAAGMLHHIGVFAVALFMLSIGFLSTIEIKKPKLIGKLCLIAVGLTELIGMIVLIRGRS